MSLVLRSFRTKLITPLMDRYRFGVDTRSIAAELEEREYWEPERLRAWQVEQLRPFLKHCYENVPFYHRRFNEVGFRPEQFEDPSQLSIIPPLTKTDIRNHQDDIFSRTANRKRMKKGFTGGSTGQPTSFYISYAEAAFTQAQRYRFMNWAGIAPGDRIVRMGGIRFTKPTRRSSLISTYFKHAENTYGMPCPAVSDALLDEYIRKISQIRARVLWGYPSAIALLAARLLETQQQLPSVEKLWVSSEVLTEGQRETMRRAFNTDPFDMYGGGDTHVAGECGAHQGKHIVQNSRLVEIVNEQHQQVTPGESGHVLVTPFLNYDWPYIRYNMGDVAELLPESCCSCGRTLPKLGKILGRTGDYVVTPEGARATTPNFNNVFSPFRNHVRIYQIVQHQVDDVEVRIVPTELYSSETEKHIIDHLRRFLGDTIQIRVVLNDEVEQTGMGKRLIVISHLPKAA
ncbi:phenylacetate--CoA ligase family protein [Rubinisphaera brasiliensis]|uniref:Phenylacetate--CoA ligase n=1 Tax=Rubinisphaera brasiliensis (strain ATCC 49424 / DSM 5305 / JCM 21570 / IAM 15109 / NBRC 103401 / IFAM 1448) TaxID=756272 RepID=F0SSG1_RUBBR|nr:phenylacetate--CoA ligase family protein [Rubinisphaera brasiliensis]ADY59232.1 hypothetical protein Plabr_1621 [Rubinisphaera brasiliensis DSM 5305]